jgi:hypothetical protein
LVEHVTQQEIDWEELEIQAAKDALAKAKKSSQKKSAPFKGLEDRTHRLFSTDHSKHCYYATCPTRYIEFDAPEDYDPWLNYSGRRGPVEGHVYLVTSDVCNLD